MNKPGTWLLDIWQNRSPRERFLFLCTAVLLVLALVLLLTKQMMVYQDYLDRSIVQLQDNLLNQRAQMDHLDKVEKAFARMQQQHVSDWSEAEIQDRMKQEILRLARKDPAPLQDGVPVRIQSAGEPLVVVPSLGSGALYEKESGVKQFRISFSLVPTQLENVVAFIKRLQESPQDLIVDGVQLRRNPLVSTVTADISVSRVFIALDELAQEPQ